MTMVRNLVMCPFTDVDPPGGAKSHCGRLSNSGSTIWMVFPGLIPSSGSCCARSVLRVNNVQPAFPVSEKENDTGPFSVLVTWTEITRSSATGT